MEAEQNAPEKSVQADAEKSVGTSEVNNVEPMAVNEDFSSYGKDQLLDMLLKERSSKDRLLRESKSYKTKAAELAREAEERQKAELEQEGKAAERAKYYQEKYEQLNDTLARNAIESAIKDEAVKAGCDDAELAMYSLGGLGLADLIEYDEGNSKVTGAHEAIAELKKQKPRLFTTHPKANINSAVPGGDQVARKRSAKDLIKMAAKDRQELLSAFMKK